MMKTFNYLLPPIIILIIGFVFAIIFKQFLGTMAWIPLVLVYWTSILLIINNDSKQSNKTISSYFKFKKFKWYIILLAMLIGLLPLPIFLLSFKYLSTTFLILSWILVALINPFFEEIFWRGYMLEKGEHIPFLVKAIISSVLFTLSHPLMWGMFAKAMLTKELIISVFIMGMAWAFIYKKSKSLVLPYFSHLLVDVFNCSVLAFMNLLPMIHNF